MVPPTDIGNELFSLLLGVNSHQVSVFQGHLMCVALAYIKAKGTEDEKLECYIICMKLW